MAITYNKKSWQSRVSEHPTRRRLTIVDQSLSYSLVDVAREEGTVEQVGDTFDKSTMDDMENRIENIAITAQAECDGLQEQIDNLPSLDETKRVDIGYKETAMNENGGSVKVNPFEIYNGTLAYKTNATQAGSTTQKSISGNITWNQLIENESGTSTIGGVTFTKNNDGSYTLSGTPDSNNVFKNINYSANENKCKLIKDHVYFLPKGNTYNGEIGMGCFGDTSDHYSISGDDIFKVTSNSVLQSWVRIQISRLLNVNIGTVKIYPQLFDLTEIFGSTTADYIYSLEQATAGAGVAYFRNFFPDDYYAYNAGTVTTLPSPDFPQDVVGIGTEQADHTWSVTVGGVTASGLAYPLYEGDILDFATGTVIRKNGQLLFNVSDMNNDNNDYPGWKNCGVRALMGSGINTYYERPTAYINVGNRFSVNTTGLSTDIIYLPKSYYNSMTQTDWITNYPNLVVQIVVPLATPTIERVTITGADAVIRGFIPSARFIEVGRKYMQEEFVTNHPTELNAYHKGYILQHGTTDKWISYEDSDGKVNSIWTQYGYDGQQQEFLESVAGEIYTATGSIPVEFKVSDIWMCGANGYSGTGMKSSPTREVNRLATNANGFPIELRPVNQSAVASLTMGSPVQFRITGTLWIVLEYDLLRDRETSRNDSNFYDYEDGVDTRNGVHYAKHYIDIDKGTTFNLSDETTLINYHFLQASVENPESLDYISFTVTDSNIAITGDDYATGIVLHIEHRKDGETESDLDTKEDIVINVT